MGNRKSIIIAIGSALGMLVLILDAKAALTGASEGIALCIRTVIPSLFPFFFLSGILNGFIAGRSCKLLRPLGKLCGIPANAEYLLLIGFTGGYPVGAQCIFHAYKSGVLTKQDAERMLGFCNNAGPAFLFGMMSQVYPTLISVWVLWGINIVCAIITGFLLPGKSNRQCVNMRTTAAASSSAVLQDAIKAMASVCGWVILFRVLIRILSRWLFWILPKEFSIALTGFLELSNGCVELTAIDDLSLRYAMGALMLSFGGLCVGLQTIAVCPELSCKSYFAGKFMQAMLCIPLSFIASSFLFPGNTSIRQTWLLIMGILLMICTAFGIFSKIHWKYRKKSCIIR